MPRCANPDEANCAIELHMQLGSSPSLHEEVSIVILLHEGALLLTR